MCLFLENGPLRSNGRVLKEIDPKVVSDSHCKEVYAPFDLSQLQ